LKFINKDNNLSDWNQFFDFLKKVGKLKNTQRFSEVKSKTKVCSDLSAYYWKENYDKI